MTVKQLYDALDKRIPKDLSCEWDNDGLMCCPDLHRQVRRVLITLDVTADAVTEAVRGEYDVILSHHPLIFKGVKRINGEDIISDKLITLIKNGISVFSFHTRLDSVGGGVNDCLAALLELSDVQAFGEGGIGRIGVLPQKTDAESLARRVKELLGCEGVVLSDAGLECHRVAVLGGSGGDEIAAAILAGADTYLSGEFKYHSLTDAPEMNINLIEAGHFYTENPVLTPLAEMISDEDENIEYTLYYSNKIRLI